MRLVLPENLGDNGALIPRIDVFRKKRISGSSEGVALSNVQDVLKAPIVNGEGGSLGNP